MSDESVKRRGRPPLDPAERKDGNLTFRTRGDLRQRLSDEAKKNGRTISEEVEWRLERSLAGLSGAETEPALYSDAICKMLGSGEDLGEAVELGMMWGRVKTLFSVVNEGAGEWYENAENIKLIKKFFDDKAEHMLLILAARRRRVAQGG
jgi:hypothetical protein